MRNKDFDIIKIAGLANFNLDPAERRVFEKQLQGFLDYIDIINEVDTVDIEPMDHFPGFADPFRKDSIKPSLKRSKVFLNAPAHEEGFFKTPKVF